MKVRVNVQVATAVTKLPSRASLAAWARAALAGLRRRRVTVTVRIVGGKESAALNSRFRHKNGPTNVLSFLFQAPPGIRSDLLGDVVICADVVRREVRAQDKAERAHWAHMVVHGIMHLRGYDHQTRKEAAVMEARETRVLRVLGFPNPYA
jgi:probable rRNA maturation factor